MNEPVCFCVSGTPIAKQSFRYVRGGGYTAPHVKAWAEHVTARAREAMEGRDPITGAVSVRLAFAMPTKRRVDCDNLAKNVQDSMRGIVFGDDCQVVNLHITKTVSKQAPGVKVYVCAGERLPEGE